MARVLYLGPPSGVDARAYRSSSELMARLGRNTGNLLFGDAIVRHLAPNTITRLADLLVDGGSPRSLESLCPSDVEAAFDVIVIGAANFLHRGFDFGRWARFLESVQVPAVILGLGAQAPAYGDAIDVPAGTERLVRIVAERSASLGVRGEFTAATLGRLGIRNVRVVGCPSMYWHGPSLPPIRRTGGPPAAVAVNGSANVVEHAADPAAAAHVERQLARLSFERGYPYVLQNETEVMDLCLGVPGADEPALVAALARRYGLEDVSAARFTAFVRATMRLYTSVAEWRAAMAPLDFVLGTRFHGSLVALLSGVPAVVLVHDARTREMCEFLRLPHADVRGIGALDVAALHASADLEALEDAYPDRYRNYVEFLDENGLPHALPH